MTTTEFTVAIAVTVAVLILAALALRWLAELPARRANDPEEVSR